MNTEDRIHILWDMDGTLFRFIPNGDIYRDSYFELLPCNRSLADALDRLHGMRFGNHSLYCETLSSYLTDSPHDPVKEKNTALDRETSVSRDRRFFIPCGESKWDAACRMRIEKNSILIDDYGKNISDWKGPYVKVSRDSEDLKKEKHHHKFCISPDNTPDEIIHIVLCALAEEKL